MKRLIIITLSLCLLTTFMVTPCSALTIFETDYDTDKYTETIITFDIPDEVPEGWLPLRAASQYLPITIDWDNVTKEIIVKADLYANKLNSLKEKRYKIDILSSLYFEDLMVIDGVTYCSPRFLTTRLPNMSFRYNGEIYYFQGETKTSKLIHGEDAFRKEVLSTMYNIKLVLPEDYKLIRSCLTGGVRQKIIKSDMVTYNAYVYPTARKPIAYIVNWKYSDIAYLIAHEAYHVWLERNTKQSEKLAIEYGQKVSYELNITKNKMGD